MRLRTLMEIALKAHSEQKDKGKAPYILHPLMVSLTIRSKVVKLSIFKGVTEKTIRYAEKASVGHDLIEDTSITLEYLKQRGLEEPVCDALNRLTRKPEQTYREFCRECMENVISHMAKIGDIVDNSDYDRIPMDLRTPHDLERLVKYKESLLDLGVLEDELPMLFEYY